MRRVFTYVFWLAVGPFAIGCSSMGSADSTPSGATLAAADAGGSSVMDTVAGSDSGTVGYGPSKDGATWAAAEDAAVDAAAPAGSPDAATPPSPGNTTGGACVPSCEAKQCGPDGCGGTCGWCGGLDSCQKGACTKVDGCSPACAGKMVGVEDGCGGLCSGSGLGIGLVPGGAQDASYFRKLVEAGQVPAATLLPIEGWLTEHGTALPPPKPDRFVTLHGFVGLFYDPLEGEPTVALQLGMNSEVPPEVIEAGRFNLCVVVDRSGSMDTGDKIGFMKSGLTKMLDALDEDDWLSIVTFSDTAQVLMKPTKVSDKAAIAAIIEDIHAAGSTNIFDGLKLGYEQVMLHMADKEATPRVILLSDGVVTAGVMDTQSILNMSASYSAEHIGLTTIGAGLDFDFNLMHQLATQNDGNFYFIDSGDKLVEVFEQEIKYLMTPIAENLSLWFDLPDGFTVEDVYGFDFSQSNGEVHILAPKPQYTVNGEVAQPPPPTSNEDPNVAVQTLFASKKNGLVMVKLASPGASPLKAFENMPLSTIHYSYELADTGELESWDEEIAIGSLAYEDDAFSYFSGAIMQRNFCILRSGLAMKQAAALATADVQGAVTALQFAITFCTGINVQLNDAKLVEDIVLMEKLQDNICGADCLDPAGK